METTCRDWFRCFKTKDFDIEDKKKTLWHIEKVWRKELKALLHEDSCQVQAELAESLGVDYTCFKTFESIRNDSKASTLDPIRVEVERRQTTFCHVWTAASNAEK